MSLVNHVKLIGGLGRDPEVRRTPSGTSVVSFSMATEESYKDNDGARQKKTEWHNCIAYGKTAEIIGQYFKKGTQCIIEGHLQTSSWDDKNGGGKRYKTDVVVEKLGFQKGNTRSQEEANGNAGYSNDGIGENTPF